MFLARIVAMKITKIYLATTLFALTLGLLAAPPLLAAPKKTTASGTFTVNGKPTVMKFGWASLGPNQEEDREVLVLLFADRDLAEADQEPARLAELAAAGKVSALRILWSTGFDFVAAVPYQAGLEGSGKRAEEAPTLNLDAFDEVNVKADVVSKRVGQHVHFSVKIEGPIRKVDAVEIEPPALVEEEAGEGEDDAAPTGSDPKSLKLRLGKLGYAFDQEHFGGAIADGNLEAVELFLKLGQSPNYVDDSGNHQMVLAALFCGNDPKENRTPILKALIAAKGEVDAKDQNNSTPLLWAVQQCDAEAVKALIAAKANVNAKAKGGATPLMMAKVFNRSDIVALLQKAGAKEN